MLLNAGEMPDKQSLWMKKERSESPTVTRTGSENQTLLQFQSWWYAVKCNEVEVVGLTDQTL